eukprot:jgi/Tetstr1/459486/TSEL_004853.t1
MVELRKTLHVMDAHGISMCVRYIRSAANNSADRLRREVDRDDWQFNPLHFQSFTTEWGPCPLDRFASEARSEVGSGLRLWLDGFQLRESSAVRLLRDGDLLDIAPCPDSPAAGGRTKALATLGQRRVREPSKRVEKTGGPSAAKRKRVVEERGGDAEPKSKQVRQIATGGKEAKVATNETKVASNGAAGKKPTASRSARRKAAKRRLQRMGVLPRKAKDAAKKTKKKGGKAGPPGGHGAAKATPAAEPPTAAMDYIRSASSLDPNGIGKDAPTSAGPRANLDGAMMRAGAAQQGGEAARGAAQLGSSSQEESSTSGEEVEKGEKGASSSEESSSEEEESSSEESSSSEEESSSESSSSSEEEPESSSSRGAEAEAEGQAVASVRRRLPSTSSGREEAAHQGRPEPERGYVDRLRVHATLLEALPSVSPESLAPGAVVAYQLLELGAGGCPEVSAWRLGAVGARDGEPALELWPPADDPTLRAGPGPARAWELAPRCPGGRPVGPAGGEAEEDGAEEEDHSPYDAAGDLLLADSSFVQLRVLGRNAAAAWAALNGGAPTRPAAPATGQPGSNPAWQTPAKATPSRAKLQPPRARPGTPAVGGPPGAPPRGGPADARGGAGLPVSGGWASLAAELAERKRALAAALPQAEANGGPSLGAAGVTTPGAVRPRGGARRTAIGPLLAMLRADSGADQQ